MYDFAYHRAATLADAVRALAANAEARPLAGGQTLIPVLKQRMARPEEVVDLGRIDELKGIRVDATRVTIGAMTTHATVAASPDIARVLPALCTLAGGIGDPHVRNRGTIGGSVANADPAADYPAAVLGLGATVETDRRAIAGDDFFTGLFGTALEEGELIARLSFPIPEKAGYAKFPQPASRFPVVGVMVAKTPQGVRVAVTGAAACVFRAQPLEAALERSFTPAALDGVAIAPDGLNEDLHASPEYRAHLVTVMARRAVADALAHGG